MFLSKEAKMAKEKQIYLQDKFNLAIKYFWDKYPRGIYNKSFFETYKDFLENNDVLSCIRSMEEKYEKMFDATQSFDEKQKIIESVKVLTRFMETYSKELTSYKSNNAKFQQTKELLLEKAKTLLSKEIEDYKKEKEQRAIKAKQEEQEKEAKRDQILEDIKNL